MQQSRGGKSITVLRGQTCLVPVFCTCALYLCPRPVPCACLWDAWSRAAPAEPPEPGWLCLCPVPFPCACPWPGWSGAAPTTAIKAGLAVPVPVPCTCARAGGRGAAPSRAIRAGLAVPVPVPCACPLSLCPVPGREEQPLQSHPRASSTSRGRLGVGLSTITFSGRRH